MDATGALAEAWASVNGKLGSFTDGRGKPIDQQPGGYYAGYMEDAAETIRRLHARGFQIVPIAAPDLDRGGRDVMGIPCHPSCIDPSCILHGCRRAASDPLAPTGWACPVCRRGNAPHADCCGHCADRPMPHTEAELRPETVPPSLLGNHTLRPPDNT